MNESDAPVKINPSQPKPREETHRRRLPPYHIILENDDYHSCEFVVEVLRKVLSYTNERCYQLMYLAHITGQAVIWTGAKEVAELKVEQIQSFHEIQPHSGAKLGPLGCRIEPAT